jgi:hypothetical protein
MRRQIPTSTRRGKCVWLPRERYDEQLVLGSGWLYKQDLKIEDHGKSCSVILQYLDPMWSLMYPSASVAVMAAVALAPGQ